MTTALRLREDPEGGADGVAHLSAAVLAQQLLAAHSRLGEWIAELELDDLALWEAIRPALARMSMESRQAVREFASVRGPASSYDTGRPLTQDDTVPPVVWAREVGAVQRLLWGVLADVQHEIDTDSASLAAALARALQQTAAVATALRAVAGFPH